MENRIKQLAEDLLARGLTIGDGMTFPEIEEFEKAIGCELPGILKQFYSSVGNQEVFTSAFQNFCEPYLVDDKIIFLEENQGVCYWAVNKTDIGNEQATVYVCNHLETDVREWFSEEISLPAFIEVIMYYQCAMGGYEFVGGRAESTFESCEEYNRFLNELVDGWEKVVSFNGLVIYKQEYKLVWHFVNRDGSTGDTIFISFPNEEDWDYFEPYEFADWS